MFTSYGVELLEFGVVTRMGMYAFYESATLIKLHNARRAVCIRGYGLRPLSTTFLCFAFLFVVGRRMVTSRSNCSRTGGESRPIEVESSL